MTLTHYLAQYSRSRCKVQVMRQLADALQVHYSTVRHWCNGTRLPSVRHVLHLEALTRGQITRYELRPDIYGPKPIHHPEEKNDAKS